MKKTSNLLVLWRDAPFIMLYWLYKFAIQSTIFTGFLMHLKCKTILRCTTHILKHHWKTNFFFGWLVSFNIIQNDSFRLTYDALWNLIWSTDSISLWIVWLVILSPISIVRFQIEKKQLNFKIRTFF